MRIPPLALVLLVLPVAAAAQVPPSPAPAPTAPAGAAPAPAARWKGAVGAGVIVLTGNTNTSTLNGNATVSRETSGWIFAGRATGVYGRTRPRDREQPAQTIAHAAAGQLRGDRKFGEKFTVFTLAGVETDRVASVEYRAYVEAGLGYVWIERQAEGGSGVSFRTDLGARSSHESRFQFYAAEGRPVGNLPDLTSLAPRAGAALRLALSRDVQFSQEAEVLANVRGGERYAARSLSKLTSRIVGAVTFGVSYLATWDSAPAPGKVETDTSLGVVVEVGL